MTKLSLPLLTVLAFCAAPSLLAAAQPASGASRTADPRGLRMPSPAEMAAQHKQMCQDAYAQAVGDVAYLEARLNLTSAQQPVFDRWKSVKLNNAKHDAADCATRELPRGKAPTPVDALNFEQEILKRRLANLDAEIPALTAFYNSLSQTQKDALSNPGQQAMMMSRHRDFIPGMGGHAGGIAVPPAYVAPPSANGITAPPADGAPNPAPPLSQAAAATPTPPPLKHNGNQSFFASVFGGNKPVVTKTRMNSYGKDKDGHFRVILTDGEIWQINASGDYETPQWKTPPSRLVVNIYEGALGSYNMEVSDDSQIYKVKRLN